MFCHVKSALGDKTETRGNRNIQVTDEISQKISSTLTLYSKFSSEPTFENFYLVLGPLSASVSSSMAAPSKALTYMHIHITFCIYEYICTYVLYAYIYIHIYSASVSSAKYIYVHIYIYIYIYIYICTK